MKTRNFPASLLFFVLLVSCGTNEDNPSDVNVYINLLASNQYLSNQIPDFEYKDIETLMRARTDQRIITNFPRNGISSYFQETSIAGIFFLWTVESIRAKSIQSKFLIGNFPSQNPIITIRETGETISYQNEEAYKSVFDAYKHWWDSNKGKNFNEFNTIDPLASTPYRWH